MAPPRPPPFLLSTALLLLVTASPLSGPGLASFPDADDSKGSSRPVRATLSGPPPRIDDNWYGSEKTLVPEDYPMAEWTSKVVPATASVKNDACRIHSRAFVREFRRLTPWALRMWDASAKIPSGILEGNIRSLGHFDECLKLKVDLQGSSGDEWRHEVTSSPVPSRFSGKYCISTLDIEAKTSPNQKILDYLLDTMTLNRRHLESIHNQTGPDLYPSFSLIEWAVCIPSSCTAQDLEISMQEAVDSLAEPFSLKVKVRVDPAACHVDEPRKVHELDYFVIAAFGFFLALMVASSAYDLFLRYKTEEKSKRDGVVSKVLLAFSAPANWERLVNTEEAPPGSLECIDGIRFLSTLWVVVTHKVLTFSQEPWVNKTVLIVSLTHWTKMPLVNSMLNVDTFFLVSALLKSYHFMKELDDGKFNILSSYAQRYLRLTPAYGVVLAFYTTLLVFLGRGPAWNRYIETTVDNCRELWFLNLLYVNNYIGYDNMCLVQSWYLAADMQMCLLSPLLIYPLWRWPRKGAALLILATAISVALPFATTYAYQLPGFYHVGTSNAALNAYMQYVYMATHNRMAPYLVGLALGCLLHKLRMVKVKINQVSAGVAWVACFVVLYAVIFGPYDMFQFNHPYDVMEASFFGAFHRFAWAIAVGWLIFACSNGYGGFINQLLSAKFFKPLSRLSYCIFLTHVAVLLFGASRSRTAIFVDEYVLFHDYAGDIFITLIASVILHICFEAPFLILVKLLFGKGRSARKAAVASEESGRRGGSQTETEKVRR
ncbi:nose resistant to fluoxetine protein 6-like [Hetaerina americana]|uniref:nose resistant to fluoxetine protein 6-like n=1 Tax=Hetaerina americana TaxID=62018 RepID=UPI003A7F5020